MTDTTEVQANLALIGVMPAGFPAGNPDTTEVQANLALIARVAAAAIADDAFDVFDTAALRSAAGLEVDGLVVWHRVDDDVVVTWAGNDHDPNMEWSVLEVPVGPFRWDARIAAVEHTIAEIRDTIAEIRQIRLGHQ